MPARARKWTTGRKFLARVIRRSPFLVSPFGGQLDLMNLLTRPLLGGHQAKGISPRLRRNRLDHGLLLIPRSAVEDRPRFLARRDKLLPRALPAQLTQRRQRRHRFARPRR